MPLAVEIQDLYFRYEQEWVLEGINASIQDREYIAIIGPNGGGKSTLLKLILGLLRPTKGSIKVYGEDPQNVQQLIGYLPQRTDLNIDLPLTAREVILQGRLSKKRLRYTREDEEAMYQCAKELEIEDILEKKLAQLSGGQRQRVLLARALVTRPKILILDEPTSAIDLVAQKRIYQLLKKLDITRIVVSHDINIILEGVNRVLYVNRKLYIHENIPKVTPKEGHFCEMELFEELQRSCDA